MNVVIVGGSLSSLTFALACANRGIRTQILERDQGDRRGGAALGIDHALMVRVIGTDPCHERQISTFPITTNFRKATSWHAIHRWLRDKALQRREITLTEGVRISEVIQNGTLATAITTDGQRFDAPVIVGADGYRSVVRRAISPEHPYALYAGYLLWRGLVSEADLPLDTCWPKGSDGVSLITTTGYRLIAYPVAGWNGSLKPGERLLSFAWYDATHNELLRELHCLSETRQVLSSLAAEEIPQEVRDNLSVLARRIWPEPWSIVIMHALKRCEVFATPIAEYFPARLHRGRLAMIGDAAHVVSPVTGKGFIAGGLDAAALARHLDKIRKQAPSAILSALKSYEDERLQAAQALATASMEWSRTYLTGVPSPSSG